MSCYLCCFDVLLSSHPFSIPPITYCFHTAQSILVSTLRCCITGPCYRCLFPESPRPQSCARCSDAGVLGVVPGIVGCLQAMEAIKIAAGVGSPLSRKLLLLDALSGRIHTVKLRTRWLITPRAVWMNRNRTYPRVDQLFNELYAIDESVTC